MTSDERAAFSGAEEPSTGELMSRLSRDLSQLVRDELRLNRLECCRDDDRVVRSVLSPSATAIAAANQYVVEIHTIKKLAGALREKTDILDCEDLRAGGGHHRTAISRPASHLEHTHPRTESDQTQHARDG